MDPKEINRHFFRFKNRAERLDDDKIQSTFVEVGPVIDLLGAENHQILYGRRGVGKTHALRYLGNLQRDAGNLAFYIDLSNLGSDGSIYADGTISFQERTTRLLIDVVSQISNQFLAELSSDKTPLDFGDAKERFASLKEAISDIRITGTVTQSTKAVEKSAASSERGLNVTNKSAGLSVKKSSSSSSEGEEARTAEGSEKYHIQFGRLRQALDELLILIPNTKVWLMMDEWSSIPLDLQPYLADFMRRSFLHSRQIVLKIGAIEHRSRFYLVDDQTSYLGFETGADISAPINLDNYLVFDNDPQRATEFFKVLLIKHLEAALWESGLEGEDPSEAMSRAFSHESAFNEFVRATEGVPRDAMHLLSGAAQKAWEDPITVDTIRRAALEFYQTDKLSNIEENADASKLLQFIHEKVIAHRQTRAFLFPANRSDPILDYLFDRRILHILDRSKSAAHRPGERFKVYKIDYGCYVDLANTDRFPTGLLFKDMENDLDLKEVPQDDARSYRRAILDIDEFYRSHKQGELLQ